MNERFASGPLTLVGHLAGASTTVAGRAPRAGVVLVHGYPSGPAGTAGAVLCVAVGGLWLAGVARARRDVQDAEEAVRALDDDQRRLLGLRQMAGNAAGVAHGGSDEDDSEDEDYAFGIAAR